MPSSSNKNAAPKPAGKAPKPGKGRTFAQMLDNRRFTTRLLQTKLRMGSRTIIAAKADPSKLSLGDIFRLANLMHEKVDDVLADILAEIKQNQAEGKVDPLAAE